MGQILWSISTPPPVLEGTPVHALTVADFDVRRFQAGDGSAIRDLHERAMREAGDFVEGVPEPDLTDVQGHYLDDGEFLVGTLDGHVVAMVAFHPVAEWILADRFSFGDDVAELTRMRVDPAHQHEGFGTEIYAELERRARAAGYDRFVLDVSEDNAVARRFYESRGFEHVDTASLDAIGRTFHLAVYRKALC